LRPTKHCVGWPSFGERLDYSTRLTEVGLTLEAVPAEAQPSKLVFNYIDMREVNEVVMVGPLATISVLLGKVVMKLFPHRLLRRFLCLNNFGRLPLSRVHNEIVCLWDPILPRLLLLGSVRGTQVLVHGILGSSLAEVRGLKRARPAHE